MDISPTSGCLELLSGAGVADTLHRHYIANISDPRRPEVENSAQSTTIHPDCLPCAGSGVQLNTVSRLAAGDVVLFSSMCPHRSLPNRSRYVRWSADVRYHVGEHDGGCHPNFFPAEAGFLAAAPPHLAGDVVSDWRQYVALRRNHVVPKISPGSSIERGSERPWRPVDGEHFQRDGGVPQRRGLLKNWLEGELEWRGRVRAMQRLSKL